LCVPGFLWGWFFFFFFFLAEGTRGAYGRVVGKEEEMGGGTAKKR